MASPNLKEDLTFSVVDAVAHLPGKKPQSELANVVLNAKRKPAERYAAMSALLYQIQKNGLGLPRQQLDALRELADKEPDAQVKGRITLLIGSLRPDARQTGELLLKPCNDFTDCLRIIASESSRSIPRRQHHVAQEFWR